MGSKIEMGPVFRKALNRFESEAEFARQVGVKDRRNVREWKVQFGYIPLRWALAVAQATGIPVIEIVNETTKMMNRRTIEREVLKERLTEGGADA